MYYQNYEDYMRSVLGYPVGTTYDNYIVENREYNIDYQNNSELEGMYPEIYKKINPVVCEVCERSKEPITKEIIENMVEEVYQKIDINNNEIWLNINIENSNNNNQKEIQNRTSTIARPNQITNITNNSEQMSRQVNTVENRQRRPNNPLLRDLIRILILNRILGGGSPNRPPRPRPPFPGTGRPPFPGGPGGMPPRPQPRDYEDYFKF